MLFLYSCGASKEFWKKQSKQWSNSQIRSENEELPVTRVNPTCLIPEFDPQIILVSLIAMGLWLLSRVNQQKTPSQRYVVNSWKPKKNHGVAFMRLVTIVYFPAIHWVIVFIIGQSSCNYRFGFDFLSTVLANRLWHKQQRRNQSETDAGAWNWHQARENVCEQINDWLMMFYLILIVPESGTTGAR